MKFNPIGWCHFTINFWWGCTEVSRACTHCYARDFAKYVSRHLFGQLVEWGKGKPRAERLEKARIEALALNRQAEKKGIRYRVFANSMSDWLDDEVPTDWLVFMLDTIRMTPHLDWQLLSKRPLLWGQRIEACLQHIAAHPFSDDLPNSKTIVRLRDWLPDWFVLRKPPANIAIGTTIENQPMADKRGPELLAIPAAVRFYSIEPMMEPILFKKAHRYCEHGCNYSIITDNPFGHYGDSFRYSDPARGSNYCPKCGFALRTGASIHWVILGGESGNAKDLPGKPPTIKPLHPDWVRDIQKQCEGHNIPFFFKQWGEWLPINQQDPAITLPDKMKGWTEPEKSGWTDPENRQLWLKAGTDKSGHLLDGKSYREFPKPSTTTTDLPALRADS